MTAPAPPDMPPVKVGTPPRDTRISHDPAKHTPATHSEMPGRTGNPGKTGEESRQESQEIKQAAASDSPFKGDKQKTRVSLPSAELRGARPMERSGGVGALPGNVSESRVALLPDERQETEHEPRPAFPRQRSETIKPSAAGGDEHKSLEKGEEKGMPRDTATPTRDEPVTSQASGVPPDTTEAEAAETIKSDVAVTPEPGVELQKETDETKGEETQSMQWRAAAAAAASEDPAEKIAEGSNLASEKLDQDQKSPSQDVQGEHQEEKKISHGRKVQPGYSGDYHPAQLHPPPPGASVAEFESSISLEPHGEEVTTSKSGQQGTTGAERKPGFISIMRGEMKILAGKMRGDEHKVEEGKKLVHGEI